MLQTTVLAFSILPNSYQIDSFVGCFNAFNRFTRTHICEQIQLLSQSNVQ